VYNSKKTVKTKHMLRNKNKIQVPAKEHYSLLKKKKTHRV